ncbi:MAG TPA: alpha/beta hydrolase [Kamptonema sp.]|nr:alpha/beta hydrolase [Kamptonema sp.]
MQFKKLAHRWVLFLTVGLGFACYSNAAVAAEKVVLKYTIIQMTIPVSELATFAKTGQMSPALEMLLGKAKKNPETVRRALRKPVKVNKEFLGQALNSKPGEMILDEVGQVIHTPSGVADREALRSALVLSASQDNEITLLEMIENYPTNEVQVEGDRLVEAYTKIASLAGQLNGATEKLQDVLNKIRLPRL